jgi:FMN reductase
MNGQGGEPSRHGGLVVVTAGVSTPSSSRLLADLLADETLSSLEGSGISMDTVVIELRDLFEDIAAAFNGTRTERLGEALRLVGDADALIVVSPVFAGSYSGMFKAFFDLLDPTAIVNTPMILGATGGSLRHALVLDHALRPLFVYLRAGVVPTSVFATASDWAAEDSSGTLHDRAQRAAQELAMSLQHTALPALTH